MYVHLKCQSVRMVILARNVNKVQVGGLRDKVDRGLLYVLLI